jgi:transcription antitermination protein NusB
MSTLPGGTHHGSQARKARICALQMMYQWEIARDTPERVKELYWKEVRAHAPRDYADMLFDAATSETAELDATIMRFARRWKIERMTSVDRNLLRLAVAEFRHSPDVPRPVVINEAVEIAKMFSGEDSHEFINAVLDAIAKENPAAADESQGDLNEGKSDDTKSDESSSGKENPD